jgi:hypothetical protein
LNQAFTDKERKLLQLALSSDSEVPSAELRAKCIGCALEATPPNVRMVQIRTDGMGLAHLDPAMPDFGLLEAPRPVTRRGLYVFLHEAAHFHLHIEARRRPQHSRELEAEKFAIARMRAAGIQIPPEEFFLARENVRSAILRDQARGIRIEGAALRFAHGKSIFRATRAWTVRTAAFAVLMILCAPVAFFAFFFSNARQLPGSVSEPTLRPTQYAQPSRQQLERWRYLEEYAKTHSFSREAIEELNRGAGRK